MKHLTNLELRTLYLNILRNFIFTFWQDIQLAKTPEEAILRFVDLYSSSALNRLKERKVFTKEEYRISSVLLEVMIYIFNSHRNDPVPWNMTDDEEKIILYLFNLIQKNILDKEEI